MTVRAPLAGVRHRATCAICLRRAAGLGYAPPASPGFSVSQIAWACLEDAPLARTVFHMSRERMDIFECCAVDEAGRKAGEFLDSRGRTDVGMLDAEEWDTFLRTVLETFGASMRRQIEEEGAPF